MTPLIPIAPADRDPKLCFIGMPATSEPKWAVSKLLLEMEKTTYPGGQRFVFQRIGNQGVAKARNILTYLARCSGASQMIMMDADIVPELGHFMALLSTPGLFVSGMYLKKEFPFTWVGDFKGEAGQSTRLMDYHFMNAVGGGFVKINLCVVDQLIASHSERAYRSDEGSPAMGLKVGQIMHDLWGMGVVSDDWAKDGIEFPRYQTEDFYFSWLWRKGGGEILMNTNCRVGHVGSVDWLKLFEYVEEEKFLAQMYGEQMAVARMT